MFDFKPIDTAPKQEGYEFPKQILCRFYHHYERRFIYFVAYAAGKSTYAPGYAKPEEWCELPNE